MSSTFQYGELFVPVIGILSAVIACLAAATTAIFGKFKHFRLPSESAPGLSRGMLNVILFVPFIVCFVFTTPQNAKSIVLCSLVGVPSAVLCYIMYGRVFSNHRYTKPTPPRWYWPKLTEEIIIGGDVLTASATQTEAATRQTIQTMLASAEYKPDEIWERSSRTVIQQRVELWYFATLLFAVIPIVAASMALQALLSDISPLDAAQIIWTRSH